MLHPLTLALRRTYEHSVVGKRVYLRAVASNSDHEVDPTAPESYLFVRPDGKLQTSRSKPRTANSTFELICSPCVPDSGPGFFIKSHYVVTGQEALTSSGMDSGAIGSQANVGATSGGEVYLHTNAMESETWALLPAGVAGPPRWIVVSWHKQRLVARDGGVVATVESIPPPQSDAYYWAIELAGAPRDSVLCTLPPLCYSAHATVSTCGSD